LLHTPQERRRIAQDLRMNARSRSSLLAPTLSAFAMLALLTTAAPAALAQQGAAPPASDSVTVLARQRYNEGVKAYDAGKFEDARAAFLQAYALKRHPAVLLNLGQSEIRSGHYEDAGNHLQQFLREYTSASPDERSTAEKGIAEAKKKAGWVVVAVDATGADVSIDGTTVGKSPLLDPVFVKPGKHTLYAAGGGKTAATSVDVKAGAAAAASLTLGVASVAPAPVPAPPPVAPPPEPVQPPPPPVQPPPPAMQPVQPPPPALQPVGPMGPMGPQPGMMPPPEDDRLTFFQWYKKKPIAWVGTGAIGLGLIGGIAFGASALSASSASKDHVAQIQAEDKAHQEFNPTRRTNICGDADGNGALPHYVTACGVLKTDISNYNTDVALVATSWVLFGVGLAGTAVYTMIDWYPHRATAKNEGGPSFAIVPVIGPQVRGMSVGGTF
jgi:hypothetical protein